MPPWALMSFTARSMALCRIGEALGPVSAPRNPITYGVAVEPDTFFFFELLPQANTATVQTAIITYNVFRTNTPLVPFIARRNARLFLSSLVLTVCRQTPGRPPDDALPFSPQVRVIPDVGSGGRRRSSRPPSATSGPR